MKTHRIEQPDWSEMRATIVVCVAAVGLSLQSLAGRDLSLLVLDPATWPARPWQLVTACLLHGSALHLLFNVYWTWQFGRVLEPILGLGATAGLYLFLAAGPMAAEWALLDGGIGLSGLVYGAFGLLWALDRWAPGFQGVMDRRTTELFAIWFLMCIVLTATDVLPVANLAHGAGAVLGALVGAALPVSTRHRTAARVTLVVATVVLALASTVLRPIVNRGHASEELVYGQLFDHAYELLEAGDPEAAIEPLKRALELRPDDAAAWNNLGIAYARVGRDDDAHAAFLRRGELDPESERSRSYLAWSLSRSGHEALMAGDLAKAVELFESSLEADPAAPAVWALLAGAHDAAGHADQARAAREQARELRAAPRRESGAP